MAKTNTKTTVKKSTGIATAPEAAEPKIRQKKSVFVRLTANELHDRIGGDVKVGISRRDLTALFLKEKKSELLASAGL